jgi:hypothetical protein
VKKHKQNDKAVEETLFSQPVPDSKCTEYVISAALNGRKSGQKLHPIHPKQ